MFVAAAASVVIGVMSLTTTPLADPVKEKQVTIAVQEDIRQEKIEERRRERRETRAALEAMREAIAAQEAAQEAAAQVYASSGAPLCDSSCIDCESGGDPTVFSSSGTYWGLYQFDHSTWVAHGGDSGSWGNASAAEQHAVASRVQYDAWPSC